jgi:predicted transcriptional regulator
MMQTVKEEVIELLKGLPDDISLEEIQYHLYVRQKVERGTRDIEEGKIYTQKEMEKRMEKWSVE